MVKNIDGKKIAEKVKDEIAKEVFSFGEERPNLAIILVGEREDSKLYVSLKEREAKKVGIDTHIYRLDNDTAEEELLSMISFLNNDELIDGILIQLPLPDGLDTDKIIKAVNPNKDVDGFHPDHPDFILSPVLVAIQASLDEIAFKPEGKSACVIYNSEVFGDGVRGLLKKIGLNKFIDKSDSIKADLIITAIGQPGSLRAENIKEGVVIIDISTVKVDGHVKGDVDFESVKDKAEYITPVPGGIGPMTIAFLLKNVLEIFKRRQKEKTILF